MRDELSILSSDNCTAVSPFRPYTHTSKSSSSPADSFTVRRETLACHKESSSQAVTAIIGPTIKSHRRVEILSPISESVPYSGKPKECCGGGVRVEQEKLRGLWVSAFGALTPVFCFLVLLTLIPEDQSDVVIGCDNEV